MEVNPTQALHLKYYHRMTPEEYTARFEQQQGRCMICLRKPSPNKRAPHGLVVDHCHSSGSTRGLLCHPCNMGLGAFQDDTSLLARAQLYVSGVPLGNKLSVYRRGGVWWVLGYQFGKSVRLSTRMKTRDYSEQQVKDLLFYTPNITEPSQPRGRDEISRGKLLARLLIPYKVT